MTPAEIAAKLTRAQVRALRDPMGCATSDFCRLERFAKENGLLLFLNFPGLPLSALARAVLAELEGK